MDVGIGPMEYAIGAGRWNRPVEKANGTGSCSAEFAIGPREFKLETCYFHNKKLVFTFYTSSNLENIQGVPGPDKHNTTFL